jgi:hypothetical protein
LSQQSLIYEQTPLPPFTFPFFFFFLGKKKEKEKEKKKPFIFSWSGKMCRFKQAKSPNSPLLE